MDWVSDVDNPHPHALSPCVGPGQVPTPGGLSPPASTGGAAQTKSQAGVTGNACCLVGEGGEGNLTARSHNLVAKSYRLLPPSQAPYHWLLPSSLFCYQLRYGGRPVPPLHFV